MYKKLLEKLIESIPILVIAGIVWFAATSYNERQLHIQADENLTTLTEALTGLIQAQQGGGGRQANPTPEE